MKTIKQFCEQSNIPAKLIRSVVRSMGGWSEFKDHAQDICAHGADAGFGQFIYYSDTVKFTKNNKSAIIECAKDMADSLGESLYDMIAGFNCLKLSEGIVAEAIHNPRSENQTEVFNALAWFALEEVARSYCDLMESN